MRLSQIKYIRTFADNEAAGLIATPRRSLNHRGHAHFWERARLSRRNFLWTAAGTASASVLFAESNGAAPRPIPGGFQLTPGGEVFHVLGPASGVENSTITDFNGALGATEVQGSGTGTNMSTGARTSLNFDSDMRFMQGEYIGVDGRHHHGTFALV